MKNCIMEFQVNQNDTVNFMITIHIYSKSHIWKKNRSTSSSSLNMIGFLSQILEIIVSFSFQENSVNHFIKNWIVVIIIRDIKFGIVSRKKRRNFLRIIMQENIREHFVATICSDGFNWKCILRPIIVYRFINKCFILFNHYYALPKLFVINCVMLILSLQN